MEDQKRHWWKVVSGAFIALALFIGFVNDTLGIRQLVSDWGTDSSSPDTLSKVRGQRKLKVGYIPYYDITSKELTSGKVNGFLVDVLYKIAVDLNIPESDIEFIETDWQNFGAGLNEGKYDLSIAGTFRTPERERIVVFTDPLFYLGNGALVRLADNRFNSIKDFDRGDVTIAAVLGEQGYEYAKGYLKNAKHKTITGSDLSLACLEVEKGLVDAALSDQYILKLYVQEHSATVKDALADRPYHVLPICWAVRKNDQRWLQYLNEQIKNIDNSGWLKRLRAEYPRIPWAQPKDYDPTRSNTSKFNDNIAGFIWNILCKGTLTTFAISFASIILGTGLGILLALVLASSKQTTWMKLLLFFVRVFTYSFLAIPPLVLIIMLYYNKYISTLRNYLETQSSR